MRSAPRPPAAALSDLSGVNRVRTCLIVLIALVVPTFMPKMFTKTWGFPDAEVVPYALAAAGSVRPSLVIVAVLAIRAVRALPDSERLGWAWPTALGGCVGYAVILAATLI